MAAYLYYQANADDAEWPRPSATSIVPWQLRRACAYYMVAVLLRADLDVGRDQDMTQKALSSFTELIRRYPDSSYASDAKLKIDLVRDHLAGKEMEVGRFYQKRQLLSPASTASRRWSRCHQG
ncbi:MAG: outer membrane protein assembly factor BamD [Geminicoccaceae bacterium]